MLFNSGDFLIFFPIVVAAYFLLPYRWRWLWLLAASYYFYMSWRVEYILLIVISTLTDYGLALLIGNTDNQAQRKRLLGVSLLVNLGLLFVFKYYDFFNVSLHTLLGHWGIAYEAAPLGLLLPVGISFYTFQTLSYTIDVYRGVTKPVSHLGKFALYVSFFPQLVAGPIERSVHLMPQFYRNFDFDYERVVSGLRQMGWGFFKKVVIADKAAIFVNAIYNSPTEYTGLPLILATYLFAFQIYCDFSGYSDIAIGAARVMGFDLMENFRQPYLARSIPEFWQRWHISLSTWFRDYLYIPLGGNRVATWRWYYNLLVVFLVSGLWHGASWTFVIWGALHGVFMVASVMAERSSARWTLGNGSSRLGPALRVLQIGVTFHLVVFAWIFFRANSLGDALYIVTHLGTGLNLQLAGYGIGLGVVSALALFAAIGWMMGLELLMGNRWNRLAEQPGWLRWSAYYAVLLFIVLFGELQSKAQFIYFQF